MKSENQIENLRILTKTSDDIEVITEKLHPGDKVEVISGALHGLEGELIEYHGNRKIVVRINNMSTSFLVTVPAFQIKYKSEE